MFTAKKIQILLLFFLGAQFCVPAALYVCLHVAPGSALVGKALGRPLYGVTGNDVVKPALTRRTWFDGDFAGDMGKWFGQNFPSRNLMVRLNNELDYDLFRKSTVSHDGVVIGKGDQLFETSYLANDCNIIPPMPVDRLRGIVAQMARMQARLAKRGVPFVVLLTPGKSAVYPEYIPDQYRARENGAPTNYDNLVPLLKEYGVTYSDGLQRMRTLRKTDINPLFCQGGIHWTSYGAYREAQDLEAMLNARGLALPPLHSDRMVWSNFSDDPFGGVDDQDYDLAQMTNTYRLPVRYSAVQPIVYTDSHAAPTKTLVVVGGSFCWKPIWLYDREKLFRQIRFYFYYHNYRAAFPSQGPPQRVDAARIDWPHDIFGADAVVLEINVATMNQGVNEHYTAFLNDGLQHIDPDGRCH